MSARAGSLLVWFLFLATTWFYARPILIFVAAVVIVGAVLLGVVRKLERQSEELARSWRKK